MFECYRHGLIRFQPFRNRTRPCAANGRDVGEVPQDAEDTSRETVVAYGRRIGVEITPHDLRRTFAKLAHQGRAPLEQIQLSLGHASIQTTERYLGVRQDLHDAPCDRLGLDVREP